MALIQNLSHELQELYNKILEQNDKMTINNFNQNKEYIAKYNFVTKNSCDITIKLLTYAETNIDRQDTKTKLTKYINDTYIVNEIEKGIFEFALIQIIITKLQDNFVEYIYKDKVHDLCINLDITNKYINNQTFLNTITDGKIKPFFIAFLSPEQVHPAKWAEPMNKQKTKADAINNLGCTDLYRCSKCKENRMKITRLQLRSADEPENLFIVCLTCYNTFIQ
jgi:DNA-directed RNA polymerase subunit M/transcription elongation factor TFIIS